jgi:uncharacterized membrane protein (TIGR01666 family)
MIERVRQFADSTNFTRAVIVTIAAVLPVLILSRMGYFEMGFAVAIGAFLSYPADIPSNLSHRIKGLLTATLIVAGCTFSINLLHPYPWLFYPFATILIFSLSMISVYGQRATMASFSGLLAVTLATGHVHSGMDVFEYTGLIIAGGLFYTLISVIFNYLSPHRYTELQIAECMKLTSKYMKLRGDLWYINADRAKIVEKQLNLQVEINTIHENLREILIRNRNFQGSSNQNRKMLLAFISLVDILELALSTSFDHSKLHEKFSAHPKVLATYQNLAYNLASSIKKISKSVQNRKTYVSKHRLLDDLAAFENAISEYKIQVGETDAAEGVWILTNMVHYAEKQMEKIRIIERAFSTTFDGKELKGRDKDLDKFITPVHYPLSTLRENLSFSSTIFRHSLRLTITIVIGFIIGEIFPLQNVYWILITIIVIMRPGYGLTKERSYQRIAGTVLGAVIAFGLLTFVHHPVVIGTLAIVCIMLGFTYTVTHYLVGATFVTIYVIFLYSMLNPNIMDVIQYRIIDTAIGAFMAFAASYFFWPSWEFKSVPAFIKKSIEANRDYLAEISRFYNEKGTIGTSYRLARKNAFIEIGNLMSSYQRMTQEPKSKQKQQQQVYKLAVLNHTLLSSLASLGTYIQSHKTSTASEAFNVVVNTVIKNLDNAIALLNLEAQAEAVQQQSSNDIAMRFTELKNIRARELREFHVTEEEEFRLKMEEAHLVIEQLVWLNSLSEKIVKAARQIELTK